MPLHQLASEELSEVSSTAYMVAAVSPLRHPPLRHPPPPPLPGAPEDGERDLGKKVVQQLVEDFEASYRSQRESSGS